MPKIRKLIPATKIMPRKIAKNTSPVPKSGCLATKRNGTNTNKATGATSRHLDKRPTLLSSKAAKAIIIITLENSDG